MIIIVLHLFVCAIYLYLRLLDLYINALSTAIMSL